MMFMLKKINATVSHVKLNKPNIYHSSNYHSKIHYKQIRNICVHTIIYIYVYLCIITYMYLCALCVSISLCASLCICSTLCLCETEREIKKTRMNRSKNMSSTFKWNYIYENQYHESLQLIK